MEGALLVSNLLLWLIVVLLSGVVLVLLRQVGILHERISPAGALVGREGPRVGERAPRVEVTTWEGAPLVLGESSREGVSTLIFFLSPTCPICKTLLPAVRSLAHAERATLRVVLASDGPRSEHESFVREQGLTDFPYVLSTDLGMAFQVGKLPHAVLIDTDGIVRGRGLVNTREHLDSLLEAKEKGVSSLQEFLGRAREVA